MASITTWTRLEPRARGDDLRPSLEARVHDPAWLLGRQWQLGEFVGEDAGSPVHVSLQVKAAPITAYRVGELEGAVDAGPPLDALAGAERGWRGGEPQGRPAPSLAERAEGGAELLQLLSESGCSAAGVAAVVDPYPLPAAPPASASDEGAAFLSLVSGRLPDGGALAPVLEEVAGTRDASIIPGLPAADRDAVVRAAQAWVRWRASLVHAPADAGWDAPRLEHHFQLAVHPGDGAAIALDAPAWDGDRLDWYDLDVHRTAAPPARPAGSPAPAALPGVGPDGTVKAAGIPAPLTYPGMPASRWWQFEDAGVNFADVTAAPEDLARMLVVEFASVYSNDWYLWPLDLPVGALHTVASMTVSTTFADVVPGDVVAVGAAPAGGTAGQAGAASSGETPDAADWQLFRPTARGGAAGPSAFDGLLLLPTLASPLEGEVSEEVRFLRDELANLAWAVEATVRGQDGMPLDRHRVEARAGTLPTSAGPAAPAGDTGPLRYRFQTEVPAWWFPLAPDPAGRPWFNRLVMRRVDADGTERNVLPAGEVLSPDATWIWQEEVPREGARVVRRHRMARGTDGALYAWGARRAETGRGEGSSGLRYDDAVPVPQEAP